jgi:hypothetical protein
MRLRDRIKEVDKVLQDKGMIGQSMSGKGRSFYCICLILDRWGVVGGALRLSGSFEGYGKRGC